MAELPRDHEVHRCEQCSTLLLYPTSAETVQCPVCEAVQRVAAEVRCEYCGFKFNHYMAHNISCPRCASRIYMKATSCRPSTSKKPVNLKGVFISTVDEPKYMSGSTLRAVLKDLGVDTSGDTEREELENKLNTALLENTTPVTHVLCIDNSVDFFAALDCLALIVRPADHVHLFSFFNKPDPAAEARAVEMVAEASVKLQTLPFPPKHLFTHVEGGDNRGASLVAFAKKVVADTVLLGRKGQSRTGIIGTVAEYVVQNCRSSAVLLVPADFTAFLQTSEMNVSNSVDKSTSTLNFSTSMSMSVRFSAHQEVRYLLVVDSEEHATTATRRLLDVLQVGDIVHVYTAILPPGFAGSGNTRNSQERDSYEATKRDIYGMQEATISQLLKSGRTRISNIHTHVEELTSGSTVSSAVVDYAKRHLPHIVVTGVAQCGGGNGDNQVLTPLVMYLAQNLPCAFLFGTYSNPERDTKSLASGSSALKKASEHGLSWDGALTFNRVEGLLVAAQAGGNDAAHTLLHSALYSSFGNVNSLSRSFLEKGSSINVDFSSVRKTFDKLQLMRDERIESALQAAMEVSVGNLKHTMSPWPHSHIRPFLVLLECFVLYSPENHSVLSALLIAFVSTLDTGPSHFRQEVVHSWCNLHKAHFEWLVASLQTFITIQVTAHMHIHAPVICATVILGLLWRASTYKNSEVGILPFTAFHNEAISDVVPWRAELEAWRRVQSRLTAEDTQRKLLADFTFLYYPCVLTPAAKTALVHASTGLQKQYEQSQAFVEQLLMGTQDREKMQENIFLIVRVERSTLLADAVEQLAERDMDFRKPVIVVFSGEDAQDLGGPKNEFFELIFMELFDPRFGLFYEQPESHLIWFCNSEHLVKQYTLVGRLLGLALYNSVIVNTAFPSVIYKHMLGLKPTILDLAQIDPDGAIGLQKLLEFEETEDLTVEDTFCRNFVVDRPIAGEGLGGSLSSIQVELKPGGTNIPLTKHNRDEYVKLYVKYYLEQAVEPMLSALVDGFWKVCHNTQDLLSLCNPAELEQLICGIHSLEFDILKRYTRYRGGFSKDATTIVHFWQVVESLSDEDKQKFLLFCTGSHRVPTQGFQALHFTIARSSADDLTRLPVAHTCFNQLDLPDYNNLQVLREKLLMAIEIPTGFGLV